MLTVLVNPILETGRAEYILFLFNNKKRFISRQEKRKKQWKETKIVHKKSPVFYCRLLDHQCKNYEKSTSPLQQLVLAFPFFNPKFDIFHFLNSSTNLS